MGHLTIGMMMRIYFVDEAAASVFEGPPLLDRDRTLDNVTLHCNTVHCTALWYTVHYTVQSGWSSLAGCLGDPMPPSILATHPLLPSPFCICILFCIFVFVFLCSYFCIWNFLFIFLPLYPRVWWTPTYFYTFIMEMILDAWVAYNI